jgi:hypothetical protein
MQRPALATMKASKERVAGRAPARQHDGDEIDGDQTIRLAQLAVQGPLQTSGATALQRTAGNQAVIQRLRAQPGAAGTGPAPVTVQTDPKPTTEKEKWGHAAAHYNLPMDSGHLVSWALHEKAILPLAVKEKGAREEILLRAKVIEKKMYGPGKWGDAMRNIDVASRISHLIGMIAGIVGIVSGVVGLFQPAALPVAAIAGVVALAAHSAMAILQSILIGYNVHRIQSMTPAEKAKVMPTIYRDILKLVFALVGVAAGGVGAGLSASAGMMSSAVLEGVEKTAHIGHLVGESVGEGMAEGAMFWGIAYNDKTEADLGMAGQYDAELDEARGGGAGGHGGPPPELVRTLTESSSGARSGMELARQSSVEGLSAVDGQAGDVRALDQLTSTVPEVRKAESEAERMAEDGLKPKKDDDVAAIEDKERRVTEVEERVGQSEATEKEGAATDVPVSRKPSVFGRMGAWIKGKVLRLSSRVKGLVKKLKLKLGVLVLKILGLKKHQDAMVEGLADKRAEGAESAAALGEAVDLTGQYSSAVKTLVSSSSGPATRPRR